MALLPILRFPDPRLKKIAAPVTTIDDTVRRLIADMAETMYEAPGIGLAATQVYTHNTVDKLRKVHAQAHPRGGGGVSMKPNEP